MTATEVSQTSKKDVNGLDDENSKDSQTASQFIDQQLALEADAREVLPYKFNECTYALGPLRQEIYACLTCSPPPASAAQVFTPAGICYSCSIQCHGDHDLVELFSHRNFVCDCGTTRLPSSSLCMLRSDSKTGQKGVSNEEPGRNNRYNHNFENRFCACEKDYDANTEKGTMYQCIGLGTVETGGCGEDWYHPECLMGLPENWHESVEQSQNKVSIDKDSKQDEHPVPEGFPSDNDFDGMICYKCVESNPWIKQYAGTVGFLEPLYRKDKAENAGKDDQISSKPTENSLLKRKASDDDFSARSTSPSKRTKQEDNTSSNVAAITTTEDTPTSTSHVHDKLPPAPHGIFSIFLKSGFRDHFCHCPKCYPNLIPHPQLVEEEEDYEPSLSESNESGIGPRSGARSQGTGSLLERGEAALNTMDRVKAIEGVMVYNHLKDKVKEFLKPYAENGNPVSAEDIKAYFEKLRGDEAAIKEAGTKPVPNDDDQDGDNRREQSGY